MNKDRKTAGSNLLLKCSDKNPDLGILVKWRPTGFGQLWVDAPVRRYYGNVVATIIDNLSHHSTKNLL